ncbi:MAG: lytic transglycosylase domain-containing protein [Candidatus Aminicenantes bacterium]|nr:lytic transglycosylase domain-containing protein [Candidatus Aminicenantes bacterium]
MIKDPKSIRLKLFLFLVCFFFTVLYSSSLETQVKTQLQKKYDGIIKEIAKEYDLEPALIHSIILIESDYDPRAVSNKGAMGLMQLMPATAEHYGVKNPFDPRENIMGGTKYLKDMCKLYYNSTDHVLAAYNAGQTAIKKYGGIPPYPETINYIEKVKATYRHSTIRVRTKIYKYVDSSGRVVLTNDSSLYNKNKDKNKKK